MGISKLIFAVLKKLVCKCKCASICEVELRQQESPPPINDSVKTPHQGVESSSTPTASPIHPDTYPTSPSQYHRPLPIPPQTPPRPHLRPQSPPHNYVDIV